MKLSRLFRTLIACLLIAAGALAPALTARAEGRRTVRVGVLNDTTFADRGDDGTWRGIDVECMIGIAQKAGFDLEFVDSSSDPDFLGSLDRGVYDVVADVVRTPEREAGYLFTDEAIGETRCTLAVRAADDRWDYGNIEQVSQMKIGVVRSYAINADFRSWCAKHTVTPVIMEYPDVAAMSAALLGGEIDGEVYSAVYDGDGTGTLRTIMKFLPESFYYAFRKDDTALKNAVDDALAQILIGNPDYLSGLRSKYEDQYRTNDLPFSAAEQRYIAAHPLLTVAVISGDAPYYKKSGGADAGVIPDYFALLAADTGFSFRYAAYASQAEAVAAVKSGAADLVGIFSGGVIAAQASGVALTDSFATVESLLMTRAGTAVTAIDRIAVRNRSVEALKDSIARAFPKAGLQTYESAQACFSALKHRRADAVVIGLPSATWLVNQTSASAYSLTPVPGASSELRAAVRGDSQLLCSILNKRIGVTKNRFPGLVTRDTLPADDWQTVIARTPSGWLAAVIAALLALVLGLTWSLRQLRRRQRERAAVLAAQAETEREKLRVEAIQRSAEERSQFFANISHDMRTPLNAIINFVRLARREGLPQAQQTRYLDQAESSGKLLLDLIDDTLTVSRLSSDKLELQLQPCRVRGLVEAVASPIREAAERKKIDFALDLSQMPEQTILADRLSVEKVFLNLLTNAVRYTPEGGHIWYTVVQEPDDGGPLRYTATVRDSGIGIGADFLPHLFEPFAQEKRRGYESVGTGLGLSIVRELVTLMGGTVTAESAVGAGTVFTVRLQFSRAPEGAVPPAAAAAGSGADLRGRTVLLCEDNALNREIAETLLRGRGMTVVSAEDGARGLELFAASAPRAFAAILMDLRMPVMGGLEAAAAIRALDRPDARTVPIIAMTADAFADDVQRCLDAGMNGHVAKPVEPQSLYAALQAAIGKSGGAPQ